MDILGQIILYGAIVFDAFLLLGGIIRVFLPD